MPRTDIAETVYGDMTGTVTDYSVSPETTDAPTGDKETWYENDKWEQQLGYYKQIPELKSAIDALSRWTIGKGYQADPLTTLTLMEIKGHGKDCFNSILENLHKVMYIGGDAFAEVIRDDGRLVNIKPLDPGTMRIVANSKGIITRYEQLSKVKGKATKKFTPDQILHLSRNRVADEIHGQSVIDAVEWIILARNEAMDDYKTVMHRYVKPKFVWKLNTDDTSEIADFKAKAEAATEYGENIYVPKDTVDYDLMSVPPNSSMNPIAWIRELNQYFYQCVGVPQIILGNSQEFTEATAKIAYLAFEQTVEEEQLYLEEQILYQLNLEVQLEFPASLRNEMIDDRAKSETTQAATPEDTNPAAGGLV